MMKTSGYIAMFTMLLATVGSANADTEIFRWVDS